eukprot:TRINITY_DN8833_c0_g1_i9.p1 TRINITY_DN8833_c0_g1~~TRINITY_DN8833_c0_g1_i9.p1  ORF type:complete len:532 (+),score=56.18 TRINITY_DN8833_c0_g1_i9:35-1630(+)
MPHLLDVPAIIVLVSCSAASNDFFRGKNKIDRSRLDQVQLLSPNIHIGHSYGDQGLTTSSFRGHYAVGSKPNFFMFSNPIESHPKTAFAVGSASLELAKASVGHIVDQGSFAALQQLMDMKWFRQSKEWHLGRLFLARMLLNDHHWLKDDPSLASLVCIMGNSTGARRYLDVHGVSAQNRLHFGVVPYARSLTQALLSEYRLNSSIHRSLIRYGRLRSDDISVPMLSSLMPHGPQQLGDIAAIYSKDRPWLLSFVGAAYRPGEPKMPLSAERYPIVKGLMQLQIAFQDLGYAAFAHEQTQTCMQALSTEPNLRSAEAFFIAPMTKMPQESNISTFRMLQARSDIRFRAKYNNRTGGGADQHTFTTETHLLFSALHLSSIFSLQLAGDGPYRLSQVESMLMGAIPVIVDWQANPLASWFEGLLFSAMARFEDVFIILDRHRAHNDAEYIVSKLCHEVTSGRYRQRQRRLRRLVGYLSYRLDSTHPDGFSLAMQLLQQQYNHRKEGVTRQQYNKVKEWPHRRRLPSSITEIDI